MAKSLRKLALSRIGGDAELWRRFRQHRPTLRERLERIASTLGISFAIISFFVWIHHFIVNNRHEQLLASSALFLTVCVPFVTRRLWQTLYGPWSLKAAYYPIPDKANFDAAIWSLARRAGLLSGAPAIVAWLTLADRLGPGAADTLLATGAAVCIWTVSGLVLATLAIYLLAAPRRWPWIMKFFQGGQNPIILAAVLSILVVMRLPPGTLHTTLAVLPAGWVFSLIDDGPPQWNPPDFFRLTKIVALVGLLPLAILRVRASYILAEFSVNSPDQANVILESEISFEIDADEDGAQEAIAYEMFSSDEARRRVLESTALASVDWSKRGWCDRLLAKMLTPRERDVWMFTNSSGEDFTPRWKAASAAMLVLAVVVPWAAFFRQAWWPIAFLFMLTVLVVIVRAAVAFISIFNIGWKGFSTLDSRNDIPIHAVYPVGPRELARVLFKVTLGQMLMLAPSAFISSFVGCLIGGHDPLSAVPIVGTICLMLLVLQWAQVVFQLVISSSRMDGFGCTFYLLFYPWLALFWVAFNAPPARAAAAGIMIALVPILFVVSLDRSIERGRFDWIAPKRRK